MRNLNMLKIEIESASTQIDVLQKLGYKNEEDDSFIFDSQAFLFSHHLESGIIFPWQMNANSFGDIQS